MHDQHLALIPRPFFSLWSMRKNDRDKAAVSHQRQIQSSYTVQLFFITILKLTADSGICFLNPEEQSYFSSFSETVTNNLPSVSFSESPWLRPQTQQCWPSSSWCSWPWIHTRKTYKTNNIRILALYINDILKKNTFKGTKYKTGTGSNH